MIAPTSAFSVFFLAAGFGGVVLESIRTEDSTALVAHIAWFVGMALGVNVLASSLPHKLGRLRVHRFPLILHGRRSIFYFFIVLGILSVIATFLLFGRVPLLAGVSAILESGGEISMHEARRMNTLNHRAGETVYFGQGYFRQIYTVVAPVFCVSLYLRVQMVAGRKGRAGIYVLFALFVLFGALNGQIWPVVQVSLYFMMAAVYIIIETKGSRAVVKVARNAVVAYFSLIALIFLYRYFQMLQGREFQNFFSDTLGRIFGYEQIRLFTIFPDEQPYRLGSTWLNDLQGLLPGSIESFGYEVHWLIHRSGWGYTLVPGIVASAYVNFGYVGVFLAGVILPVVFLLLFDYFVRSNAAVFVAAAVYLSFRFAMGVIGDLSVYVIDVITSVMIVVSYVMFDGLLAAVERPR